MKQKELQGIKPLVPWYAKLGIGIGLLLSIIGMFNASELKTIENELEEFNLRQEMHATEIQIINDKIDMFLSFEEQYMNITDDAYCLALNIYHEARGETTEGKLAVGNVTLNRVVSDRFPNNVCAVVFQGIHRENWKNEQVPKIAQCHFSWYCDGKSDEPKEYVTWAESVMLAQMMLLSDTYIDLTDGATHYHSTNVKPWWCKDMEHKGQIGNHVFYYEI